MIDPVKIDASGLARSGTDMGQGVRIRPLIKVDFPTFDLPAKAISGPLEGGNWSLEKQVAARKASHLFLLVLPIIPLS